MLSLKFYNFIIMMDSRWDAIFNANSFKEVQSSSYFDEEDNPDNYVLDRDRQIRFALAHSYGEAILFDSTD